MEETKTASTTTVNKILYILDKSGSMASLGKEPLESMNTFVQEQKSLMPSDDTTTFTLFQFSETVVCINDDVPLRSMPTITEFEPSGMTALYDAIGVAIEHMKSKEIFTNVICVILTDGHENSSKKYTASKIKTIIKEMETSHQWKFIYVGANQDAFEIGGHIGVSMCANFSTSPGGMLKISRAISAGVSECRSGDYRSPVILSTKGKESDNIVSSMQKDIDVDIVHLSPSTPEVPPRLRASK